MAAINPYLNFKGNTEEAFIFYRSVFGGEFASLVRFKDTPEASRVSAAEAEKIMHISLPIGNGNILMATDALESMGHKLFPGNNFTISYTADNKEDADEIFTALAAGGNVQLPIQVMFWGAYFGMLTDKFGIQWMVSFDQNLRPQN